MGAVAAKMGLSVIPVAVPEGLHLKSSVTALDDETLLISQAFCDVAAFAGFRHVRVPAGEEAAANSLWVKGLILLPSGFDETRHRVEAAGFTVRVLDNSEIRRMDGGFSCLSLRW